MGNEETKQLKDHIVKLEKRIEQLEEDSKMLHALQAAGVDNWEGYEYAFEILEGKDPF